MCDNLSTNNRRNVIAKWSSVAHQTAAAAATTTINLVYAFGHDSKNGLMAQLQIQFMFACC